jgi:hypothetical protein
VIHANRPAEEPRKEDRVLQAPGSEADVRSFGRKENSSSHGRNNTNHNRDNNKNAHANRSNANGRRNNNEAKKPVQESKNVTVRTFGHKKKDSGETK